MAEASPIKSAVAMIEISFREVGPIYDLYGGRTILGPPDNPKVVFDARAFNLFFSQYDPPYLDEALQRLDQIQGTPLSGVYQALRVTGFAPTLRTFSRQQTVPIKNKWIYMFVSEAKDGDGLVLGREMVTNDKAEISVVDLQANAGKYPRAVGKGTSKKLYTVVRSLAAANGPYLWFLLAPHQIPWSSLQVMLKDGKRLASRCQRLFDPFWTDGYMPGSAPKPFIELKSEIEANTPLGFMIYLVDPFKEALRRVARFAESMDDWMSLQMRMSRDAEYVLAKRFENLPQEYAELIANRLSPYLVDKEAASRAKMLLATNRLEDLMRWVGECHQRDEYNGSDTWYHDGKNMMPLSGTRADRQWFKPFDDLVHDYNREELEDEIHAKVGEIIYGVYSRMGDLPRGQDFIRKVIEDFREREADVAKDDASAGAELFFEVKRRPNQFAAEFTGKLVKVFVPEWVRAYEEGALEGLSRFLREKHGIKLRRVKSKSVSDAIAVLEKRPNSKTTEQALEKLRKHFDLKVDSDNVKALKLTEGALNHLMVGVEYFNMRYALIKFGEERDIWASLGLVGASMDAYASVAKLVPKLESVTITLESGTRVIKVVPALGAISGCIDTVLAAREAYGAGNFGMQAGHVLRSFGAALTVGGAASSETGVGAFVGVFGFLIEMGGSALAAHYSDLKMFLRHSRWGETDALDSVSDWTSDKNDFGYKGRLSALKDDIPAQSRALDWLLFGFDPGLRATQYPKAIFLKTNPKTKLTPEARWSVKLDILDDRGSVIRQFQMKSSGVEHVMLSANDEITVVSEALRTPTDYPTISQGWGTVQVKGTVELDVQGDGRHLVTHEVDEKLSLDRESGNSAEVMWP